MSSTMRCTLGVVVSVVVFTSRSAAQIQWRSCAKGSSILYECVTIFGMLTDFEGNDFNGVWHPVSSTSCWDRGTYVYQKAKSSLPNIYLCNHNNSVHWTFTDELCNFTDSHRKVYCDRTRDNIAMCQGYTNKGWLVQTQSGIYTESIATQVVICPAPTYAPTWAPSTPSNPPSNSPTSATAQPTTLPTAPIEPDLPTPDNNDEDMSSKARASLPQMNVILPIGIGIAVCCVLLIACICIFVQKYRKLRSQMKKKNHVQDEQHKHEPGYAAEPHPTSPSAYSNPVTPRDKNGEPSKAPHSGHISLDLSFVTKGIMAAIEQQQKAAPPEDVAAFAKSPSKEGDGITGMMIMEENSDEDAYENEPDGHVPYAIFGR